MEFLEAFLWFIFIAFWLMVIITCFGLLKLKKAVEKKKNSRPAIPLASVYSLKNREYTEIVKSVNNQTRSILNNPRVAHLHHAVFDLQARLSSLLNVYRELSPTGKANDEFFKGLAVIDDEMYRLWEESERTKLQELTIESETLKAIYPKNHFQI